MNITPNNTLQRWARQGGLSLIEMLVAMAISVTVMSGVVQVLVVSKSNFVTERELSALQENARFAIKYLSDEVRMAGNAGCSALDTKFANTLGSSNSLWYAAGGLGIRGYEHTAGIATFPSDFSSSVRANTDALVVKRGEYLGLRVSNLYVWNSAIPVLPAHSLSPGEILVAASPNCSQVTIFQSTGPFVATTLGHASGATPIPGNCRAEVMGSFSCPAGVLSGTVAANPLPKGTNIMRLRSEAYYIAASATDATIPSLYRQRMVLNTSTATMTTQAQELVQGVENMQITYGIDPGGDGVIDRYVTGTAANVPDWNDVVAVRINLRMRSLSPVYNTDTPYGVFEGVAGTNGSDRFMRQNVSTTVKIRN